MPNIRLTEAVRALAVALALATGPAAADPPAVYGARRAEGEPFRDWRLRCSGAGCAIRTVAPAADGTKLLEVEARGPGAAGALTLRTPLPLFLPDGVEVAFGGAPALAFVWRTCGPDGCVAEAPLGEALLAALRREREAEVALTLAEGLRVRFPVSLLGFAAAWQAMAARAPAPAEGAGIRPAGERERGGDARPPPRITPP